MEQQQDALPRKIKVLEDLNSRVLELTDDDGVEEEIERADEIEQDLLLALAQIEAGLTSRLPSSHSATERRGRSADSADGHGVSLEELSAVLAERRDRHLFSTP